MSKASRAHNAALETGVVVDLTHDAEGVVRGTDITDGPFKDGAGGGKTEFGCGVGSEGVNQIQNDARAGGSQRMSERYGAAVRIQACVRVTAVPVLLPFFPAHFEDRQCRRGEGLVHFNLVHLFEGDARFVEGRFARVGRADAHVGGIHAVVRP